MLLQFVFHGFQSSQMSRCVVDNLIYEVFPKSKCTDFPMYELVT